MASIHQSSLRGVRIRKKRGCSVRSLQGCCHKKGIVTKLKIVSPKKPNSARRRVGRVKLTNNLNITIRIRGQGHNLQTFSNVLVSGGRANDLPGVRYSAIKGKLDFNYIETFTRINRRSKYGISLEVLNL